METTVLVACCNDRHRQVDALDVVSCTSADQSEQEVDCRWIPIIAEASRSLSVQTAFKVPLGPDAYRASIIARVNPVGVLRPQQIGQEVERIVDPLATSVCEATKGYRYTTAPVTTSPLQTLHVCSYHTRPTKATIEFKRPRLFLQAYLIKTGHRIGRI